MGAKWMLLWGEDDFAIALRLRQIEDQYGNHSESLFNVNHLDGKSISLEELKGTLYSLPLFASRRLVVLSQAAGHFQNQPARKQFLEIIAGMPGSNELVLIEPQKLASDHWLLKWFYEHGRSEFVAEFRLRKGEEMGRWIQEQVKNAGGKVSPEAVVMLSGLVNDDSRMAYQEIEKLLTYVNFSRRVEVEDVEAVSVSIAEGNVFAMVDALGNRDGRNALALLHQLLDERDALPIFQMIVRQFRMILVARELMDSGGQVNDLTGYFRTPGFVSKKVWSQARQFSMITIEQVFHQLLELDDRIKVGNIDDRLALESFVAEFTNSKTK